MNNIIHTIRHTARAATVLLLALLTAQTAGAEEGDITDFVTVSSQGTATARFVYSDHVIIAHAITERLTLLSSDQKFAFYRSQGLDLLEY